MSDPLLLNDFHPEVIAAKAEAAEKKKRVSAIDISKEQRLQEREQRLQQQQQMLSQCKNAKPAAATPAAKAENTEEVQRQENARKTALLDKLEAYRNRFPHLKKRNNVTHKSALSDIEDEVHYCELQLGGPKDGAVGNDLGRFLVVSTMQGVEMVTRDFWNPLHLKLHGLAQVTRDNMDELGPLLDEMFIKYGANLSMSVETRLCLTLGALILTVHSANARGVDAAAMSSRAEKPMKVVPAGSSDL